MQFLFVNQAYRYFDKNRVGYLKVGAPTGTYFCCEIFYALYALVDLIYTMFSVYVLTSTNAASCLELFLLDYL